MSGSAVRRPGPALAPFVSSVGYAESSHSHARELALPSGTVQLLVNLDRDEMRTYPVEGGPPVLVSGAAVHGPYSRPVLIDPADQRRVMWVAFRVGGAYPFVRAATADLRDAIVDLADLWGREGVLLRERLLAAPTPAARLDVLEAALVAAARGGLESDEAVVAAAAALHRGASVAAAADGVGWTPKRLGRAFAVRVGLPPKRFARVRRFQRLVRVASVDPAPDWARLAAEHGYHDQAHLIHEFRAHAARTPGEYRPRSPGEPNHVPV